MPVYNTYTPLYQPYSNYQPPYQPQYQQPQMIQQPVQQQMPQQVQPAPQMQSGAASIIWIGSEKEAAMYPVAPNNAVTLWNQNEPVVYLKQADASGKPTLKVFDLVERPEAQPEPAKSAQGTAADTYATKQELAAVAVAVKDLDGFIASIREEIRGLKEKPAKKVTVKQEANDDE